MSNSPKSQFEDTLSECLYLILLPIARFCLRRSIKLKDFVEVMKRAMVRAAEEELQKRDSPVSASRVTLITGVHRKDVPRILNTDHEPKENSDIIRRVINEWRNNSDFLTKNGKPRVLGFEGEDSEFAELVQMVSLEFPPYPVLFELERSGAAIKSARGLKLVHQIYVPPKDDMKQGYSLLGQDIGDLISCVQYNLEPSTKEPNLHIRTEYDNIAEESVAEVKKWLLTHGSAFHRKVQQFMKKHDCDINPRLKDKKGGYRISLGSYSTSVDEN